MNHMFKMISISAAALMASSSCTAADVDTTPETAVEAEASMSDTPMVGGAAMYADKTIVENASQASNLTTLVSAVKQAELVETLSSEGPFTVFAPTNVAFELLPEGTVTALMQDENRDKLQAILKGHVIAGKITAADLMKKLEADNSFSAETVAGTTLNFSYVGDKLIVSDETGKISTVSQGDIMQSNGVVHVIDGVLLPAED